MAFFWGVSVPLLLVSPLLACSGRTRSASISAAPDLPVITFDQPGPEAMFDRGAAIAFAVSVSSKNKLSSVLADVTGAVNFQFPAASPGDSSFVTILRVATSDARGDSILVTVKATDILGNQGVGRRSVRVR